MNHSKLAQAFRAFAESFALLAEALEEAQGLQGSETNVEPTPEAPEAGEEPKKATEKPATRRPVSKKVWEEDPSAEEDPWVVELKDLQDLGRQVIKLHGAPALAKVLKAHGLKNLSSADPKDYLTLYVELKELADD